MTKESGTAHNIDVGDILGSQGIAIGHGATAVYAGSGATLSIGAASPRLSYRSEIAHLLRFYPEYFAGRQHEIALLIQFALQEEPGYLLIEAPAGYGKSAIIAQLIHLHESGHWETTLTPHLVYFFVRQTERKDTAVSFLQSVNAELLDMLQIPGGTPPDVDTLRAQFSELWSHCQRAVGRQKPLLLLVDGLDEMASGELTIAQLLPVDLGLHTHVVVTSRPNPKAPHQVPPEHPLRQAQRLKLGTLSEPEVSILLKGLPSRYALTSSDLAHRLLSITNGEPLFVRFVCQEIAQKGPSVLAKLEKNPPAGIDDYFRQQLEQLRDRAGGLSWSILGLSITALDALTIDEVCEILKEPKREIQRALRPIARFFLSETRIELQHTRLRELVMAEFSPSEKDAYEEKLASWYEEYKAKTEWPDQTPSYIVRHYGEYLEKTNAQPDQFYRLLSRQWARLWQISGQSVGFLDDAKRAWKRFEEQGPRGMVRLLLAALCYSSAISINSNMGPELLRLCLCTGKIGIGDGLMIARRKANLGDRAECLALVAEYCSSPNGQAILREALQAASALQSEAERSFALGRIGKRLSGDLVSEFLAVAKSIRDGRARAHALMVIADSLTEIQKREILAEALSDAQMIEDRPQQVSALLSLGELLPDGGNQEILAQALSIGRSSENPRVHANILGQLAEQLSGNLLIEALEDARTIQDKFWRVLAIHQVVDRLASSDQQRVFTEAVEAAQDIPERQSPVSAKRQTDWDKQKNLFDALGAARNIRDDVEKAKALGELATLLPDDQLGEIFDATCALRQEPESIAVLSVLASRWSSLCRFINRPEYQVVSDALWAFANAGRIQLLGAIDALAPVIEQIGGIDAVHGTTEAIIETAEWWP